MRILFTCRPAYGHLFPLLPLANAARAAGHDVVFAIGDAETEARRRHGEDAGFLDVGVTMFAELLPRATLDDLTPLLPALRPDLVVYEQSDVGAGIAARRSGFPAVSVVIGRSMPPEKVVHELVAWAS